MSSELSELDELIESDVLEALGEKVAEDSSVEIDGITIEDMESPVAEEEVTEEVAMDDPIEESVTEEDTPVENTQELSDEIQTEDIDQPLPQDNNEKSINTTDLATLLSELLNNKTIEITIKVKD